MVTNRWQQPAALDELVYASRLLGADPALVLHGGGNTSAKARCKNILGEPLDVLYVKGSGTDMAVIEAAGFPALDLAYLRKLEPLPALSDEEMVNQLRTHLLDAGAPSPSVEALLHAFLPHPFIFHTHPDAILVLTNQPQGERLVQDLFGKRLAIVPYCMPGFALAKLCAHVYARAPHCEGLVLLHHGLVTWGETGREAYGRTIEFVRMAERSLPGPSAAAVPRGKPGPAVPSESVPRCMAAARRALAGKGLSCVLALNNEPEALSFASDPHLRDAALRGPLTPDHVLYTKRVPMIVESEGPWTEESFAAAFGKALEGYCSSYEGYFRANAKERTSSLVMLDPLPRVVLAPGLGVLCIGKTARQARIVSDLYQHTMEVITETEQVGLYEALPAADIFDVEYWSLEQAKLKKSGPAPRLRGKTALITGAAGGIGAAIAREFVSAGACVALMDRDEERLQRTAGELYNACKDGNSVRGLVADVASATAVGRCFEEVVRWTGGIDIVVQNAGLFPSNEPVEEISEAQWRQSLSVNVDGALHVCGQALRWMGLNHSGGDLLVVASKNVPAPGRNAGAYSVAKAAQTQLARVCALEGGERGIRVNILHPHLVFDTGLWSAELLASRAAAYKMSVEEYCRNNLLRTSITSKDVARAALALVDGSFSKTTGAQIPLDGGSERTL